MVLLGIAFFLSGAAAPGSHVDLPAWEARLLRPEVAGRFDRETLQGIRERLRFA